jgi:hypothetical protein
MVELNVGEQFGMFDCSIDEFLEKRPILLI